MSISFRIVLILSFLLLPGCNRTTTAEPPASTKGVTDPEFDWERPVTSGDSANRNWLKLLTFDSTKSLEDTTRWLKWAIEHHGHVKAQIETIDVRDVRFDRCTMRWSERRVQHLNEREEGVLPSRSLRSV